MMRKILVTIITFAVVLGVSYLLRLGLTKSQLLGVTTPVPATPVVPVIHTDRFYDEGYFKIAVTAQNTYQENAHILGGIIPHHLLSSHLIADLFARLVPQKPQTVILIGPNHHETGDSRVITSDGGWQTKSGVVFPDSVIINQLVSRNLARIDYEVSENEHSVSGMMDFLHFYLPDTRVVPLVVSGKMDIEEVTTLAEFLKDYISEKTVIVAPVDFSHYLTEPAADKKDEQTIKLMQAYDYPSLMRLSNDHFDSPPAIVILLMTMSYLGKPDFQVKGHTNSGDMLDSPYSETTSHFEIIFPQP